MSRTACLFRIKVVNYDTVVKEALALTRADVFRYVQDKYGTEPDYPWIDAPSGAVLRHVGSRKWYGLIMRVGRAALGLEGPGSMDVMNLKLPPPLVLILQEQPGFRPAYHMNRSHWISVYLDEQTDEETLHDLIDRSYELTRPPMPKKK